MAIGSGLGAQIGIANETTVNTPVAVTVFTPFLSETLERRPNFAEDAGLAAGALVEDYARWLETSHDAGGQVTFNVPNKGFGKWLQAMMGSYTTTATQQGATTAWQQIHNIGSADGKTFTLQKGVPSTDGTTNPLTLTGCKVTDWTLSCGPNALVQLQATIDAMDIKPTGAGALGLQTASYSAGQANFGFHQVNVQQFSAYTTVTNVLTPTSPTSLGVVRNVSLKGGQPKANTRWQANSTTKAEQLVNNYQPITGQVDVDFDANSMTTLYTPFAAGTLIGLQIAITGPIIASTFAYQLVFTLPACRLESGSTPKVSGPDVVTVSYPFTAKRDTNGNALQAIFQSTDTAV